MMPMARLAVASAVSAALAASGCGLGAGEEVGEASLRITRDYGGVEVRPPLEEQVRESDTVLRLLDRNAEITTRYGGRFVESVDGIEGGRKDGRIVDWFYSVNGVEASVGAAEYELSAGDQVWWDYRDWTAAMRVPATVGAFPEPFAHGYEGERHPVALECMAAGGCDPVEDELAEQGVEVTRPGPDSIRILAGPWTLVRRDPAAALIEDGPGASGVFADFSRAGAGWRLVGLDPSGEPAFSAADGAALVAAVRKGESPPVWVLTGTDEAGVIEAQQLFSRPTLAGRYAVGPGGRPLPAG
jgi:hypothetical protein